MATFAERLRKLRNEKDITLDELAEILETTKATLSRYENSLREPKAEFVQRVANYFNVTTDYIMGQSDFRESADEWWEKDETPSDIDLEDFIKNSSNIKLMGNPLDEKAKKDVLIFLRAAHQMIKEKRKNEAGEKE